jgi:hypothetical protein
VSPSPASETGAAARELGRRFAAAGALLVALVSLVQHAPLWLASLRGFATLLVLGFGTRLGAAALARAVDADLALARSKEERA